MATEQKPPEQKKPSQVIAAALRIGALQMTNAVHSDCPCGQAIVVGDVDGVPCVLHAAPLCKDFEEKELVDYLHWVNVMHGKHN